MNIPLARGFCAAALSVIATCGVSLPAMAGGGPDCQGRITSMDAEGNPDGQLSAGEHAAGAGKRFEAMDANKDARITASEINASHGAESIVWANQPMSSADRIKKLDANNDGALTAAEYADGSQKMFSKLDVDGNGQLTPAEMHVDPKSRMSAHETK